MSAEVALVSSCKAIDLHILHVLQDVGLVFMACQLRQLLGDGELCLTLCNPLMFPDFIPESPLAVLMRFDEVAVTGLLVVGHGEI